MLPSVDIGSAAAILFGKDSESQLLKAVGQADADGRAVQGERKIAGPLQLRPYMKMVFSKAMVMVMTDWTDNRKCWLLCFVCNMCCVKSTTVSQ